MRLIESNKLAEPSFFPRSVLTTQQRGHTLACGGLAFNMNRVKISNALLNKMVLGLMTEICQEWIKSSAKAIMFIYIKSGDEFNAN